MPVSDEVTPRPDRPPLDAGRLAGLAASLPGLSLHVVDETTSTNALAAGLARDGAPEGLVVLAEHQSAGRGRLDRGWTSPRGASLILSLVLRPTVPPEAWPWLPLLAGYATATALAAAGHHAGVKWPNDVLGDPGRGERKLAGILVERVETPAGAAAVVGIGLNVDLRPDELPVDTATSLAIEAGRAVDRLDVLGPVLARLWATYGTWHAEVLARPHAPTALATAYAGACVTVGRAVRVELPHGRPLSGTARTVDAGGRLVVRTDDGRDVAVSAGDVVHVRPRG